MCEKPMALNLADADRMIRAARDNDVRLTVGHCLRFWPEYVILKEYVPPVASARCAPSP